MILQRIIRTLVWVEVLKPTILHWPMRNSLLTLVSLRTATHPTASCLQVHESHYDFASRAQCKVLTVFAIFMTLFGCSSLTRSIADEMLTVRAEASNRLVAMLDSAQTKMVKIYGAGGLRGLESYQSGLFVSDQGHVLTSWSTVLDVETIRVVTSDGKRWDGKLLGVDPQSELAVIKIDAEGFAFFNFDPPNEGKTGDRVFGISNLFGIATGSEQSSVQQGTIMAITSLSARRGRLRTPYRGSVYVLDLISNNPGATGGALIDIRGQLVGMLGKELRDDRTNVYLNFAIPASVLAGCFNGILQGKNLDAQTLVIRKAEHPHRLVDLGIVLLPNVLPKTPAFVDRIAADSLAEKSGLKSNDLILLVNDRRVDSQKSIEEILSGIERADYFSLTIQRDSELLSIEIHP